jgi:hypothetical protein
MFLLPARRQHSGRAADAMYISFEIIRCPPNAEFLASMATKCNQNQPFSRRYLLTCLTAVSATLPFFVACSSGSGEADALPVDTPDVFSLPREIAVSLAPYRSVDEALHDEQAVDWLRDKAKARAITLAYAAKELREHLALAGVITAVVATDKIHTSSPAIILQIHERGAANTLAGPDSPSIDYERLGDQGYAIIPWRGQIYISANDRVGVLNGVYGFLDQLGFAWFDPYETFLPTPASLQDPISWHSRLEVPSVKLRGYWVYGDARIPDEFAVWMARNRLNVGGRASPTLHHRLGLIGWGGGHDLLQEEFSRPGLFEQHPEWFALFGGVRRPVQSTGNYFNPAFSNAAAAHYFAERMIQRLETGDLRDIDILNIWPTDDRFNLFDQSPEAAALGNETDNLLNFYVNLGARFQEALTEGRLSRPITLAGISYFLTMLPPTNSVIIRKLEAIDYIHLFYPIDRSWSGQVDAHLIDRDANRKVIADMRAWRGAAKLSFGLVEYYNSAMYAAIDLSDFPQIDTNFLTLSLDGDALYAYVHPLLKNPGARRLTNRLLSRLAWKELPSHDNATGLPSAAGEALIQDYFARRYGIFAPAWRAIHELMAQSVDNAQEMFGINSFYWLLCQELLWTPPVYTRSQVADFIPIFRKGGRTELPGAFSNLISVRAVFRGLDDSLQKQERAAQGWMNILVDSVPAEIRRRMESDVDWFNATNSRYRLMAATSDYLLAQHSGQDVSEPRLRIVREVDFLRNSSVTADTISPVDQRSFLDLHIKLVEGG